MATTKTDCRGVIFQFNAESVLFEFMNDGVESIGSVSPFKISLNAEGKKIPQPTEGTVVTSEDIAKHVQVGDEIICDVAKKSDLPKFTYVEEEEEVTEFGDVINRSNKVEITPEWQAEEAVVVGWSALVTESGEKEFKDEELEELEGQLDTQFDKESKTKKDEKESKKDDDQAEFKPRKKEKRSVTPPPQPAAAAGKGLELTNAKVVSLKPPVGKVGRQKIKVTSGVMEILDGRLAGKKAHFQNNVLIFWGQPMAKADLSYNIKAGDEFQVRKKARNLSK